MGDDQGVWDRLKDDWQQVKRRGFNTGEAATQINDPNKDTSNSQFKQDMKLSPMERALKVKKGFENYGK